MAISAKELAKITGVSPATISMVMNNKPGISRATRDLVLNAAAEYGYNGKKTADLPSQSSIIQLIIYKKHGQIIINNPFFSEITEGITQACADLNCLLNIAYFYEYQDQKAQLSQLKELDCAGILILGTEMDPDDFRLFDDFGVPIVILDAYYDDLDYDCVTINNIQGAYHATNYLLNTGHKNVGYLHSSVMISNFNERADGYFKALRAHSVDTSHPYVHRMMPTSQEGYLDMLKILDSGAPIADAYFADNDIIAAAAIKAFKERGYKLPSDISIVGFDNMTLCDMISPSLTTMNVRKKEMGVTAVKRLLARIEDPTLEHLKMSIATKMILRDSVSK